MGEGWREEVGLATSHQEYCVGWLIWSIYGLVKLATFGCSPMEKVSNSRFIFNYLDSFVLWVLVS